VTTENLGVKIEICATPNQIWSVLSDLKRMPEWSPQCRRMQPLGALREGTLTVNWNRQGRKFWPTVSKVVRFEPNQALAFRTLTNDSTWDFEIAPIATGSELTERRLVPPKGTKWVSKTIVQHLLGGEDSFDDEMVDGMNTTLASIKDAVENARNDRSVV
jgi:hypothetical protein